MRTLLVSRVGIIAIAFVAIASLSRIAYSQKPTAPSETADRFAADEFYQRDAVQSVYLQVAEEDLARMRAALPKRITVRGSFRWRNISIENVGIRFKGNSSSAPRQSHKRSYLVRFDEYDEGQRFLGLHRASFDNGIQFGSLFSEPIITEILQEERIPTHRCNYAKLFLNGEYQGVYGNVERIDESFIARRLSDPNGLLFKVDEGGPAADLQYLGDDPAAYDRTFEPETKATKKRMAELVKFIKSINQLKASESANGLDALLETDDFLRITAVMLFSGAFDQLTGWQPHNYYLYRDGKRNRWRYLPWDLDVGFCEVAFGQIRVIDDWNAAWPIGGHVPNPLLERITADPVMLRRYRETARTLLDKYFEPERLCAVIDAKYALIKDDLQADPFPHRRVTNPGDRGYDEIVTSMKAFVRRRYETARQQLEHPGEKPRIVPRPLGPPPRFVEKVQRLQRAAEAMQKKGEDVRPIQKLMQQIGPLLQQGRFEDAEKLVIEALQLTGEEPRQR